MSAASIISIAEVIISIIHHKVEFSCLTLIKSALHFEHMCEKGMPYEKQFVPFNISIMLRNTCGIMVRNFLTSQCKQR